MTEDGLALMSMHPFASADPVIIEGSLFDARRPLEGELEMGVDDGFTLTAVGDCVSTRPLAAYLRDERFAAIVDVLRRGHVRYGNCEINIADLTRFAGYPYAWDGDYPMMAQPAVADDLARLGFTAMSRANNHALDWGVEGMRETSRHLEAAGIVHAGVGEHRGLARAPAYVETPQGRVGLLSFTSTFLPVSEALPYRDAAPGRPGVSALKVYTKWVVSPDVLRALAEIPGRDARIATAAAMQLKSSGDGEPSTLSRFRLDFVAGERSGTTYEVDEEDLADILRHVRLGKQHSDFLIAALHTHEARDELPFPEAALLPPAFLQPVAHAAIDAGADAFLACGTHNLGPIEVYRGRPIFYGLGNFLWSDLQEPLAADLYHTKKARARLTRAFAHPERATHADYTAVTEAEDYAHDWIFESIVASCQFAAGTVSRIELHPVWLRYGESLTRSGIPAVPSSEQAYKILEWLREASAPYGTGVEIEGGTACATVLPHAAAWRE
jgi:poly-gamma-glutamate synthesis protein (capsule biosynthesis protein)